MAAAYTRVAPVADVLVGPRVELYLKAINMLEGLVAKNPDSLELVRNLALNHKSLAGGYRELGDAESQLASIQKAIHYDKQRLSRFPESPAVKLHYSFDLSMLGTYDANANRLSDALAQFQQVLELRLQCLAQDAENVWLQGRALYAFSSVGSVQSSLPDHQAAAKTYEDGLALSKRLEPRPEDGEWNRFTGG